MNDYDSNRKNSLTTNRNERLEQIENAIDKLASGDFDVRLSETKGYDIVESIARDINTLAETLRSTYKELTKTISSYQELYEDAPHAYLTIGAKGIIQRTNYKACEMLGFQMGDLFGKPLQSLFADSTDGKLKIQREFGRFLAGEEIRINELAALKSDGRITWTDLSISPIRDDDGKVVSGRCLLVNTSEQKINEEIKKHLNTVLFTVNDTLQIIATAKNREEMLKDICDSLVRTGSYSNALIVLYGESGLLTQTFSSGNSPWLVRLNEYLASGDKPDCIEKTLLRKGLIITGLDSANCAWCPASCKDDSNSTYSLRLDNAGTVYGVIMVSIPGDMVHDEGEQALFSQLAENISFGLRTLDIETERKQAEEAQRESRRKLKTIFDNSSDAIIIHDFHGGIIDVNNTACERLNYSKDHLVKLNLAQINSPENEGLIEEYLNEIKNEGYAKFETVWLTRDVSQISTEIISRVIEYGETTAILSIARDITEHKRLIEREKELAAAEAAASVAERNAEELRDLVDIASHELLHPTTLFKGYAEILLQHKDDLDSETIVETFESINKAADRLTHTVRGLLDTSKIDRSKLELSYSTVFPEYLVSRSIMDMRTLGLENEFIVKENVGNDPISIDNELILKAIVSLLENAVKFSPENAPVEIWFEQDDSQTVFSIRDHGSGIPERDREKIFDRFYQVEDVLHHSIPGIGLGLYITKTIIEGHGGWIRVDPAVDKGSVFSFGIPF
ncbi:MAG: PAS domain S-box protein [Actinobacteria bacterium]|nr:PAS domain S-box protein [Actinomycetota bacterium]